MQQQQQQAPPAAVRHVLPPHLRLAQQMPPQQQQQQQQMPPGYGAPTPAAPVFGALPHLAHMAQSVVQPPPPPAAAAGPAAAAAGPSSGSPAAAAAAGVKKKKARIPGEHKETECIICFGPKVEVMCLPCKHWQLCKTCADDLQRAGQPCPTCRRPVDKWMLVIKS
jgi:hypothetical protein